jgi:signal transduction histidine kinase
MILAISVAAAALPQLRQWTVNSFTFFVLLAVYSAAAHTSGRGTLLAGAMSVGLYAADLLADLKGIYAEGIVFDGLLFGAPWAAGRAMCRWRLSERRVEQEKARTVTAIADERARIARELHDVVAHSISVVVLQARGGRRVIDSDPDDAREAFVIIERTAHQALEEMRRLLGMLRKSDEEIALAPQRRASGSSTGWSSACERLVCRWRSTSRANHASCRRASISPRTGIVQEAS